MSSLTGWPLLTSVPASRTELAPDAAFSALALMLSGESFPTPFSPPSGPSSAQPARTVAETANATMRNADLLITCGSVPGPWAPGFPRP